MENSFGKGGLGICWRAKNSRVNLSYFTVYCITMRYVFYFKMVIMLMLYHMLYHMFVCKDEPKCHLSLSAL